MIDPDNEYVVIRKSELEGLRRKCDWFRQNYDPTRVLAKSPSDDFLHCVTIGVFVDDYNALTSRLQVSREMVRRDRSVMAPLTYERCLNALVKEAPTAINGLITYFDQVQRNESTS